MTRTRKFGLLKALYHMSLHPSAWLEPSKRLRSGQETPGQSCHMVHPYPLQTVCNLLVASNWYITNAGYWFPFRDTPETGFRWHSWTAPRIVPQNTSETIPRVSFYQVYECICFLFIHCTCTYLHMDFGLKPFGIRPQLRTMLNP